MSREPPPRKALQLVAVVGGLVGASFNATFVNDIGRAACMSNRRRWITERSPPDSGGAPEQEPPP